MPFSSTSKLFHFISSVWWALLRQQLIIKDERERDNNCRGTSNGKMHANQTASITSFWNVVHIVVHAERQCNENKCNLLDRERKNKR